MTMGMMRDASKQSKQREGHVSHVRTLKVQIVEGLVPSLPQQHWSWPSCSGLASPSQHLRTQLSGVVWAQ